MTIEHKGYTYSFEEEDDGDCRKIFHTAIDPSGNEISIGISPYTKMTQDLFEMLVELDFPKRGSGGSLSREYIMELFLQKKAKNK